MTIDLRHLRDGTANVLLIGPDDQCAAVIQAALPGFAAPVASWQAPERLILPPSEVVGTLILRGVDGLDGMDQRRLLDWLEAEAPRVIATADASLVTRVERGTFLDSLYYRLNTMCIEVDGAAGVTFDRADGS